MMKKQHRSGVMASIHETAEGLHLAGVMDTDTMRKFDEACLTPAHPLMPPEQFGTGDLRMGEIVTLRARPDVSGAITQVIPSTPEARYVVFLEGKIGTYYASQLQRADSSAISQDILPLSEFQARLTALLLRQPSLRTLYSLHAARVNFVPYQFRPVIKFVHADRPRLLIADEVGVGKTIEAGLILREMQARREVRSVLIICPRPLVTERKWHSEMQRFDEEFVHLDGPTLQNCLRETDLNGTWPERYSKCIVPFSLFDDRLLNGDLNGARPRTLGLLDLDPPPAFDLVIVDEAHHLRNPGTFLHQGVRYFVENAEAAVFLSATPVQLGSEDLFVLLNMLRPDLIQDRQGFNHITEPNPFINAASAAARSGDPGWRDNASAAMEAAGNTAWGRAILKGDPAFLDVCNRLGGDPVLTDRERLSCIREIENLHTLAGIVNRTRRRDIGNFTMRKAETVEVPFTPQQKHLHDHLLDAQMRILQRLHGTTPIHFLMSTLRRQAASCVYGLAPLIENILSRRLSVLEWDEADYGAEDVDLPTTIAEDIAEVLYLARHLDHDDPKLEALHRIIDGKQALVNNKILLFSSFRHTLRYLLNQLASGLVRIGIVHGDVPDMDRAELMYRFSLDPSDPTALDLLLSSEIGCEGLDFQFCDCLVNYDLPWNPMRVEQRIGRIDRYGQTSETVAIYNLITPGTVDFDIYERCLLRIGVFRQALGGSEEILGRITNELHSVADNLTLTEEERQQRLQQLADNDIRLLQEQEKLEQEQAELFGIIMPPDQIEAEVSEASSPWLTPLALQNLVQSYLTTVAGGDDHIRGDRPLKSLRLGQEARNRLIDDFRRLPRQNGPLHRDWERWLKGSEYLLDITFDATQATKSRSAVFITPVHPLAQQAALAIQGAPPFRTAVRIVSDDLPPGRYPFAVYDWHIQGIRDDAILQPVCANPQVTEQFVHLLQSALPVEIAPSAFPPTSAFDDLEEYHYQLWTAAKTEHEAQTRQIAATRLESLTASHQSRVSLLQEQLSQVTEDRIRRMRTSQLQTADADYKRRRDEINAAAGRADILTNVVALGLLIAEPRQ